MNVMSLHSRIEKANAEGRVARIPFLTAGFPDQQHFISLLRDLDANGADIIEIGVPFSDPVADGPVVEQASRKALEQGVSLRWIFDQLKSITPRLQAGLVLMGYYNPFLQYGFDQLIHDAKLSSIQGLIIPDLPLGEGDAFRAQARNADIDIIALVGPNTSVDRMQEYAKTATGYVYVVSAMGTTGVRGELPVEASDTISLAQKVFSIPVALGFGIKEPSQIAAMKVKPHAAVFGSALLQHIDEGKSVKEFMNPWTANV